MKKNRIKLAYCPTRRDVFSTSEAMKYNDIIQDIVKEFPIDVVDLEGMFRIIESIPSKKAEPIKLWLARLGKERIDEEYDPEITINRALDAYRRKGYSDDWINQRLKAIDARKELLMN